MIELKNSRTTPLGGGKYQLECYGIPVQMRENGGEWVDIDPHFEVMPNGNLRIVGTPYNGEIDPAQKSIFIQSKLDGKALSLKLDSIFANLLPQAKVPFLNNTPVVTKNSITWTEIVKGVDVVIHAHNSGVTFKRIVKTPQAARRASFIADGDLPIDYRAYDKYGQPVAVQVTREGNILTEDFEATDDQYPIEIDPSPLIVQPSGKDTHLNIGSVNSNYSADTFIQIYSQWPKRAILEYDISEIPGGATLDTATLNLYDYLHFGSPGGYVVWAYKQTHTDWVEAQATWNIYKTGSSWTAAGGDYVTTNPSGGSTTVPASAGAWMSWNVLAIVQDAYDLSIVAEFLIKYENEELTAATTRWYSRRYTDDTSLCPKLTIEYTELEPVVVTPGVIALNDTEYIPVLKFGIIPSLLALTDTEYAPILKETLTPTTKALSLSLLSAVTGYGFIPTTLTLADTEYAPVLNTGVIPTTLALSDTEYVPILNFGIIPSTLALNDTEYIPKLEHGIIAGLASLTITKYIPILKETLTPSTLSLSDTEYNAVVGYGFVPGLASLTTTKYIPVLKFSIIPSTLSLTDTEYIPNIYIGTIVTPSVLLLSDTEYIPTIAITAHVTVTPSTLSLLDTEYIPQLQFSIIPSTLSLSDTEYAPVLQHRIIAGLASLSTTEYIPVLKFGIIPSTLSLTDTEYVPILKFGIIPATLSLDITEYIPIASVGMYIIPGKLGLSTSTFIPVLDTKITPEILELILIKYIPSLIEGSVLTPATLALILALLVPSMITKDSILSLSGRYGEQPVEDWVTGISAGGRYG